MDFPLEVLLLGMQVHRAPRAVKAAGTFATVLEQMGRSIIAGCTLSTSLARAYLRPAVGSLHHEAGHMISEHVDDVGQLTIKAHDTSAVLMAIRQGVKLAQWLVDAGLVISDKSVIVSNKPQVAARVARQIRNAGFPVKKALGSEDLGVSTRGGAVRTACSLKKRCRKAKKRAARIGVLVKTNRRATSLYETGVEPQQAYEGPIIL